MLNVLSTFLKYKTIQVALFKNKNILVKVEVVVNKVLKKNARYRNKLV